MVVIGCSSRPSLHFLPLNDSKLTPCSCTRRFSCQLELHHYQSLTSHISSANLFPTWVNGSSSSILDAFTRLDQYKNQLLSGALCINMDLQGSFRTDSLLLPTPPPSILSSGGLIMQSSCPPADCGEASSCSKESF